VRPSAKNWKGKFQWNALQKLTLLTKIRAQNVRLMTKNWKGKFQWAAFCRQNARPKATKLRRKISMVYLTKDERPNKKAGPKTKGDWPRGGARQVLMRIDGVSVKFKKSSQRLTSPYLKSQFRKVTLSTKLKQKMQ